MTARKGSLLALRDRGPAPVEPVEPQAAPASKQGGAEETPPVAGTAKGGATTPSRQGKKAMTGHFSPELSFAMHVTARKHGLSLQDAMAEAFNDWLRKMGESPVGK